MYQRYWGGNIDEGWTRLLLEQFGFPYTTLMDAEIKKGKLNEKYDVIILPDDSTAAITGDRSGTGRARVEEATPPEYRSGIGNEGVDGAQGVRREGRDAGDARQCGQFRDREARSERAQRDGGQKLQGVLVPRLDAQGRSSTTPTRWRTACRRGPGALHERQPGVRDYPDRAQRAVRGDRALCRPRSTRKRLADRRADAGEKGRHGLGEV